MFLVAHSQTCNVDIIYLSNHLYLCLQVNQGLYKWTNKGVTTDSLCRHRHVLHSLQYSDELQLNQNQESLHPRYVKHTNLTHSLIDNSNLQLKLVHSIDGNAGVYIQNVTDSLNDSACTKFPPGNNHHQWSLTHFIPLAGPKKISISSWSHG